MKSRTEVGIVGGGPAGLLLAHLLRLRGVSSTVLEMHDRAYLEQRVRAGVLEQGTVDTLVESGLGDRLLRDGMRHHKLELRFADRSHFIDVAGLTGRCTTVYGQQEVVRDLIAASVAADMDLRFEAGGVSLHGIDTEAPALRYTDKAGEHHEVVCNYVAGCDGFRGVSRRSIPSDILREFERSYPFAWLGILTQSPPLSEEIIYANHSDGFALSSMRSREVSRLYVQVGPQEAIEAWPDERIWRALRRRLSNEDGEAAIVEGPVLQRGITTMRSYVAEPMQWGRLFLAGDAAHIVPPTGAKGMNLAVADVRVLARALYDACRRGDTSRLETYSATCLKRVWQAERFSWWLTSILHRFDSHTPFERRIQLAELEQATGTVFGARALAENYVGLPFADAE